MMDHDEISPSFDMKSSTWDDPTRNEEVDEESSENHEYEHEDDGEEPEREPLNNVDDLGRGILKTNENKMGQYTILLVGETGTGKTSFLSLLANILTGNHPKRYKLVHDESNEAGGARNQSQTNSAKLYEFTSTNGITVRVLDTPGLVDTRGLAQDEIHKASIANAIEENIPFVNAVIILANGTVERLGAATDYALSTLSSIFPRTLADNIGILFTNVASPLSWNFDQSSLPNALRGMKRNQFLLDNPLAMWKRLIQLRNQKKTSKRILRELEAAVNEAHAKALKELALLFNWLDTITPQPTKDIINLYEKSQQIECNIANALSRASQLKDKKEELVKIRESADGDTLTMQQYENYKQVTTRQVWEQVATDNFTVICSQPHCYSNCNLNPIQQGSPMFIYLITMFHIFRHISGAAPVLCRTCNHPAEHHRFCRWLWKQRDEVNETVDEDAERKYGEAKQRNDEQHEVMVDLNRIIARLDEEVNETVTSVGWLVESYASLSLMGSFAGQVKKAVRLMEVNLEALRNNKSDSRSVEIVEKGLENMKRKLRIVEEAGQRVGMNVIRIGGQ